jgi:TfoX/Sxy family transcriptional regulator of competence genes
MPYDEDLASRLRELLADETVTEKRMFGGLAFLVGGHMTVAASHTGGVLARVDPEADDYALAQPGASLMEMRGRPMKGWIMVEPDAVRSDAQLAVWVEHSLAYVKTLPPK